MDSATVRALSDLPVGWDMTSFLLADIFHAVTGSAHPARPKIHSAEEKSRARSLRAALEAQKQRAASAKKGGG
jgi:hypothetical protein